jgi:hypothetical protein
MSDLINATFEEHHLNNFLNHSVLLKKSLTDGNLCLMLIRMMYDDIA